MAFNGLNSFVERLEQSNELLRVSDFFDPELEISEVTDRFSKLGDGGKALLFENNGTKFPLLINSMGSDKRICEALNFSDLEQPIKDIANILKVFGNKPNSIWEKIKLLPELKKVSDWFPKIVKKKAACHENILRDPDLSILPVLKCWPFDGGRFITLPLVHTKDPVTGIRNVGMYRMQVLDSKTTGMHWHLHKTGARHFAAYKQLGKLMPIAVVLGGDPAYTYSATAPLPDNLDEYILAGFLRKRKVELVKCITQDIEVPIDADIVIEGYVDPSEDLVWEGPFGDHTGFYSLADWYPRFHVTCITHRNNAIYPATIVGIPPQEDAYIAKATEKIFITPIKLSLAPEVIDFTLPMEGTAHNLVIVKIKQCYPGQAIKVMNAMWGAGQMMFNKIMVVVDENVDIYKPNEVLKAIAQNVDVCSNIHFSSGPTDVLDHASYTFAFSGKMGIDATSKAIMNLKSEKSDFSFLSKQPNVKSHHYIEAYSMLFVAIEKDPEFDFKNYAQKIVNSDIKNVKFIVLYDSKVDTSNTFLLSWLGLANIDPLHDCILVEKSDSTRVLVINASSKRKSDGFSRDWPNAIAMNENAISKIDSKWEKAINYSFIESPSNFYKQLISNEGAVQHKNT